MKYTEDDFANDVNEAVCFYVKEQVKLNDKYMETMEDLLEKAEGLKLKRIFNIINGASVRISAAYKRIGPPR
jgi:hypothetical protein